MENIFFSLFPVERIQMAADADSLTQLSQGRLRNNLFELGLTDQNDLDHLEAIRLQVGKQTDFFQRFGA